MVRDKPLLALRALRRLSKQGDQRAFVVRLARLTQARPAMTLTDTVARVLDAELKDLSGGDCVAFLRGFAERRPALRDRRCKFARRSLPRAHLSSASPSLPF